VACHSRYTGMHASI